jgi:hypothetical protein
MGNHKGITMTQKIKFAHDFMDTYEGTSEQLNHILNKINQHIESGGNLEELASSITYGVGSYDKIFSIKI